ncbi:MAG: hypothetical protein ACI8V2_003795 [Candidatus Latescibacterota bacterium]|jgi:hypothetical protein
MPFPDQEAATIVFLNRYRVSCGPLKVAMRHTGEKLDEAPDWPQINIVGVMRLRKHRMHGGLSRFLKRLFRLICMKHRCV